MKDIKTLGIDLAKTIFQLHGIDKKGKCVLKRRVTRGKLLNVISQLPPCLIGMEACGSAHYWAREFQALGHQVKLMAPQFVKPYVKSNKNDRNDAEGICEAVSRPNMRFVPIKTREQQDMLLVHRARELAVKHRTALSNQIRGLLAEYGITMPKGYIGKYMATILSDAFEQLTESACVIFNSLYEQYRQLDEQVESYDKMIQQQATKDKRCQALLDIEGVGPVIATVMVATIGDGHDFKKGREVSAWLGIVPKQHSSGNKERLGGISKRGDSYIRKTLIQGAKAVVYRCDQKTDRRSLWLKDKKDRCGLNKAAVALANKNVRIIWAMLSTGECYRKPTQNNVMKAAPVAA